MKRLVPLGLPELPIAPGDALPNPGTAALVWSIISGAVIVWTGGAWALADTTGTGGGSGSTFTESEAPPATPAVGDVWVKTSTAARYTRVLSQSGAGAWAEI